MFNSVRAMAPWGMALVLVSGCATSKPVVITQPTVVEVACGECLFHMKGDDCDLAVRIDGHPYFVDGVNADALGDAHARDGICSVIRQARVTGEVKGGRFVATSFQMLPETAVR